jgi:aspartate racemase
MRHTILRSLAVLLGGAMLLIGPGVEADTAHAIADELEAYIQLPLIHIATATATEVSRHGTKKGRLIGYEVHHGAPLAEH